MSKKLRLSQVAKECLKRALENPDKTRPRFSIDQLSSCLDRLLSPSEGTKEMMTKGELIALIKQAALLQGDFTLRSGRKSKYYLDKYLFESKPAILSELGRRMARHVTDKTVRVAGAALGGIPLAVSTSMWSGLPFVIVRNKRKDYGTTKLVEGGLNPGDHVLLLEDVATTGGQILEAAEVLQKAGAIIEGIVAVVDRQEGARQNIESAGFQFESILTKAELGIPDDDDDQD